MEGLGAMKITTLKKRNKHNTAVKGKPRSEPKIEKRTQQVETFENKSMPELLNVVKVKE